MNFNFVQKSGNRKTGPIPIIMSDRSTCPHTCPFMNNGCYANQYPIKFNWTRLSTEGLHIQDIFKRLKDLPPGTIVRYGDAGDLPGNGKRIYRRPSYKLADIAREKKLHLFGYTHYLSTKGNDWSYNLKTIKEINKRGFVVNVSVENLNDAKRYLKLGLPVAMVVAKGQKSFRKNGVTITICRKETHDTTCSECGNPPLCANSNRKSIVGFPVHGIFWKKALTVIGGKHE